MPTDPAQLSKFLSFVLRHKPDAIGLALDVQGWVGIDELVAKAETAGTGFSRGDLLNVVETSNLTVSADSLRIRAAQSHAVAVEPLRKASISPVRT